MLHSEHSFHGHACSPSITTSTRSAGTPDDVIPNSGILCLTFSSAADVVKQGLLCAGLTSSTAMTGLQPLSATATKAPASLCSPSTTSTLGLISLGAPCKRLRFFEQPNVICLSVFLFINNLRKPTICTLALPTSSVVGCCIALLCTTGHYK